MSFLFFVLSIRFTVNLVLVQAISNHSKLRSNLYCITQLSQLISLLCYFNFELDDHEDLQVDDLNLRVFNLMGIKCFEWLGIL